MILTGARSRTAFAQGFRRDRRYCPCGYGFRARSGACGETPTVHQAQPALDLGLALALAHILCGAMPSQTHEGAPGPGTAGRLWVVSAPLGNPDDLSPRARSVLAVADLVLAEDTRSARRILSLIGSRRSDQLVVSCFDANESSRALE